jgi:RimJ/RimL family protein N-acetyltransferase
MLSFPLTFQEFSPVEGEILADWLSSETWPFHSNSRPSREGIAHMVDEGAFHGETVKTFWVLGNGREKVGLLRLFDLDDDTPLFDLWIREAFRGQGIGKGALEWLTTYLFTTYPHVLRIGGNTREDNRAMRKLFRTCGYVKEAHYRKAWPTADGRFLASVGYAILREDWAEKKLTAVTWDDEAD